MLHPEQSWMIWWLNCCSPFSIRGCNFSLLSISLSLTGAILASNFWLVLRNLVMGETKLLFAQALASPAAQTGLAAPPTCGCKGRKSSPLELLCCSDLLLLLSSSLACRLLLSGSQASQWWAADLLLRAGGCCSQWLGWETAAWKGDTIQYKCS